MKICEGCPTGVQFGTLGKRIPPPFTAEQVPLSNDGTTNIGNSNLNSSGVSDLDDFHACGGYRQHDSDLQRRHEFRPSTSPVLYQVVQGAIAPLSPTSLNFGNQTVGITSNPQYVTLQNTGNINLTITSIQITGTNSGDFAQTNNCPGSVAPNGSCQISVTFTPTATGTRNAAVTITDNAPDSPQSVPLTGVGVLPAVILLADQPQFRQSGCGHYQQSASDNPHQHRCRCSDDYVNRDYRELTAVPLPRPTTVPVPFLRMAVAKSA